MRRCVLWLLAPLLALSLSGCGYNEIQRLDEQVNAAWAQALNQYERRAELVPKLVSSVDAYMAQERTVLTEVTEARARVSSLQVDVGTPQDAAAMQQFMQAQGALSSALSRLIAVSENYPQLKSDALFQDLMTQLEGTENRIAAERGRYVKAVQDYNLIIRQFPTLITARIFGYSVKEQYGFDREASLRRDPDVRFNVPARATP